MVTNNAYTLPTAVFLTPIPHEHRICTYSPNAYPRNVVLVFRIGE